jgi:hypothetical protein
MKKIYLTPNMQVVDVEIESLMAGMSNTNIKPNGDTGFYVEQGDVKNTAGSGTELDAAGYRSNLWDD